jgi:predicted permease
VEFTVVGRPPAERSLTPTANYRMVSPGFFRALGIPLRRGRGFRDQDEAGSAPVAVINESLARRFFAGFDPVGSQLTIDDTGRPPRKVEIVGVVGDVKHYGLDDPPSFDVYVPMRQIPPTVAVWLANNMSFVVRTVGEPLALAEAMRQAVRGADPQVPASAVRSMEQELKASLGPRRFNLLLVELFAAAALLLAAFGTYAVTAQAVAQRTRELGVRIALGARRPQILALVLAQGARPVAVGMVLGLFAALACLRLASDLLFGVSATDPRTLVAVVALLGGVALAALYLPARRATRVDPVVALRTD